MAKAKCGGFQSRGGVEGGGDPNPINDITDDILDADLILRSFGISDDYPASGGDGRQDVSHFLNDMSANNTRGSTSGLPSGGGGGLPSDLLSIVTRDLHTLHAPRDLPILHAPQLNPSQGSSFSNNSHSNISTSGGHSIVRDGLFVFPATLEPRSSAEQKPTPAAAMTAFSPTMPAITAFSPTMPAMTSATSRVFVSKALSEVKTEHDPLSPLSPLSTMEIDNFNELHLLLEANQQITGLGKTADDEQRNQRPLFLPTSGLMSVPTSAQHVSPPSQDSGNINIFSPMSRDLQGPSGFVPFNPQKTGFVPFNPQKTYTQPIQLYTRQDLTEQVLDTKPGVSQFTVPTSSHPSSSIYSSSPYSSHSPSLYTSSLSPSSYTSSLPPSPSHNEASPRTTPRPSPASTPPPLRNESKCRECVQCNAQCRNRFRSGRTTPTGKRSRPQTPTRSRPQTPTSDRSEGEMSDGGYREREPHRVASGRFSDLDIKPNTKLEDMIDEDKYQKRKRSTSDGGGNKKDPIKAMLDQLQSQIPHIGNPEEEKVSHAGLLIEGSDYIRSLMRENNATHENVEALKMKVEELNAEIEHAQEKLPEHGSTAIHRIISARGKSIPDMFADHVRQRTQDDWRYWVFTSIMGHFVHSFAQEVSNISKKEMEKSANDWIQERMSLQQLRKDAFRKLAKLCSKTSIMENPGILPDEARGFVELPQPAKEEEELDPPAFRK